MSNNFISPTLTTTNLDLYTVRTGIFNALEATASKFRGRFLDVGSGNQPYREFLESNSAIDRYTPLDLAENQRYRQAENTWDGATMPFKDNVFDCAMATEVLEHCPYPEVTLCEVSRVLKKDGLFFFTVPFVWPLHDCPYDEYRYTPWSLERHLNASGFDRVELFPTGGWNATLAQVMGLWVRRSPMGRRRRIFLSHVLKPIIKRLLKTDEPSSTFTDSKYLMPGIAGTARVR